MHFSAPQACLVPTEVGGGHWTPGTEVMEGCELPGGGRVLNPCQPVLLSLESSLRLPAIFLNNAGPPVQGWYHPQWAELSYIN